VRPIIHPLPGTVFRTGTELLGPTSRFAQPLLGHVGPATADIVKASAGRVGDGDQTGLDGLQRVFDAQLAGTQGVDIYAADADGTPVRKLAGLGTPKPGNPVQLTLDRGVQTAADAALTSVPQSAAIVALRLDARRHRPGRAVPARLDLQDHHCDGCTRRQPADRDDARAVPQHKDGRRAGVRQR
jgi:hypothetical protein